MTHGMVRRARQSSAGLLDPADFDAAGRQRMSLSALNASSSG